jgi:hypothetical protein
VQVPTLAGSAQVSQAPVQAASQQTPATQKLDAHSLMSRHLEPGPLFGVQTPLLQYPGAHSWSVVHLSFGPWPPAPELDELDALEELDELEEELDELEELDEPLAPPPPAGTSAGVLLQAATRTAKPGTKRTRAEL